MQLWHITTIVIVLAVIAAIVFGVRAVKNRDRRPR